MSSPESGSSRTTSHRWTEFELRTVLSLICRRVHIGTDTLGFATALNKALHGSKHDADIPVAQVGGLLRRLYAEKKGALAFIESLRARRITRTAVLVFARNLDFDGSLFEWDYEGRRQREAAREPQRLARLAEARERRDRERFSQHRADRAVNGIGAEGDKSAYMRNVGEFHYPTPVPRKRYAVVLYIADNRILIFLKRQDAGYQRSERASSPYRPRSPNLSSPFSSAPWANGRTEVSHDHAANSRRESTLRSSMGSAQANGYIA